MPYVYRGENPCNDSGIFFPGTHPYRGYSVKAKGIAKDLFGTYENYVLPVQQLQEKEDLIGAFEWLRDYEQDIRKDLSNVMPAYKERALSIGREIESL